MWLLFTTLLHAETLWATEAVEGVRWPGATIATVHLVPGDAVDVLVRDGGLVRVKRGLEFGWVPAEKLSAEEPKVDLEIPGLAPTEPPAGGQ